MLSWQCVTLIVSGNEAGVLSDALIRQGAISVDLGDADAGTAAEQAHFGEPGESITPWVRSRVTALFPKGVDANTTITAACTEAGIPVPREIAHSLLSDRDWVRLTQSQFKPIRIVERLWIVPTWANSPDPRAINLRLDPGAAFGTGSHATTRLCLRWLEQNIHGGESVLDYGCGSGILAIAAARLGAARVFGVDIDEQAVLAARANALQNQVAAKFFAPGAEPKLRHQIVVANILANPLITLAPLLAAATMPNGHIVLSGVLEAQADEVIQAYAAWFDMVRVELDDGWALIAGSRLEGAR